MFDPRDPDAVPPAWPGSRAEWDAASAGADAGSHVSATLGPVGADWTPDGDLVALVVDPPPVTAVRRSRLARRRPAPGLAPHATRDPGDVAAILAAHRDLMLLAATAPHVPELEVLGPRAAAHGQVLLWLATSEHAAHRRGQFDELAAAAKEALAILHVDPHDPAGRARAVEAVRPVVEALNEQLDPLVDECREVAARELG